VVLWLAESLRLGNVSCPHLLVRDVPNHVLHPMMVVLVSCAHMISCHWTEGGDTAVASMRQYAVTIDHQTLQVQIPYSTIHKLSAALDMRWSACSAAADMVMNDCTFRHVHAPLACKTH